MNKVLTAIDKSGSFRVYMTISTDMVQKAADIHNTTPLATAALGRVLTGARTGTADIGYCRRPGKRERLYSKPRC